MKNTRSIQKYKEELRDLFSEKHRLDDLYDHESISGEPRDRIERIAAERNALSDKINALIETEYAKAVFDEYKEKKPNLVRIRTGEIVDWNTAFGDDFESISKSLRHSLVGLVEEPGRYRLK
ncbi:MAG: hypothetical protein K6B72_03275 [Lachnospiraceae bacterium]|nr:hypothetical protein [Lachnospiraceae bacterium]